MNSIWINIKSKLKNITLLAKARTMFRKICIPFKSDHLICEADKLKKDLTALLENFEKSVPPALRACARNADGGNLSSIHQLVIGLSRRIEYVRTEQILVSGGNIALRHMQITRHPIVLTQNKYASMSARKNIRCNICCGNEMLADYLNVWMWSVPGVDIVAEVGNLPFVKGEVKEIRVTHMDDTFPVALLEILLPYWADLLGSNGLLRCTVTDVAATRNLLTETMYVVLDASEMSTSDSSAPLYEITAKRG